jgi:hypothetical protein
MSDKDQLVSLSDTQVDPYKVQGSDFSVKSVTAFTKQSGAAGSASGKDELATLSLGQESPRDIESSGHPGISEWVKGKSAAFSVGTNDEGGTSVSISESVNLKDGYIECKGAKRTPVQEVPESAVSIG